MIEHLVIRPGRKQDLPRVLELIRELAAYERAPDEVEITLSQLERDGFGPNPLYHLLVAEVNERVEGMALWFVRYSTWKGPVLYLEDIVVNESLRRQGIGRMLFEEVIMEAQRHKMNGMRWQVLEWNEPALNFYRKYEASFDGEWLNGGLTGEQVRNFIG